MIKKLKNLYFNFRLLEKSQKLTTENVNKIHASVYLKGILNYSQILAIIITINFKLPFYVYSYFEIAGFLGSLSSQTLSFDCILNDFLIQGSSVHIKFFIFAILPFFIWFLLILFGLIRDLKNRKKSMNKEKMITYFIIISNYLQPFILQTIFDNLNCKELDGQFYLYKDMTINCESENHQFLVIFSKNNK